jgi:hypothetical protein
VIIKVPLVSPESSAPSNSDFAFLNELETIKKFQGVSNLVQCYGCVRLTYPDPPRHGMVLEKAQFGSLADLLNRPGQDSNETEQRIQCMFVSQRLTLSELL